MSTFSHVGQGWLSSARNRGGAGWKFASISCASVHFHSQVVFAAFPAITTVEASAAGYRLYLSEHQGVPYGTNPALLLGNYWDSLAFLFGAWIAQTAA